MDRNRTIPDKLEGPCVAPWHCLAVRPDGYLYPDGQFSKAYGHISVLDTSGIWNSEVSKNLRASFKSQKMDSGCTNCAKKEGSIGHSRRVFFDDKIGPLISYQDSQQKDVLDIRYLDLNLSNKCNLKCLMCNSASSSSWIKEETQLRKLPTKKFHLPEHPQYEEVNKTDILRLLSEPTSFRNLKYIGIHGGEPFLEKLNLVVLKEFVRQGIAKNITLEISTNGTALDRDFLEIFKHYKQINFFISLEATDSLYQYIRGGKNFSFPQLMENINSLRKHENLNIVYAITVSIYNIFDLSSIIEWYQEFHKPGEEIILKNVVVRPEYLNFQILPPALKSIAAERLVKFQKFEDDYLAVSKKFGPPGIKKILNSLQKEIYDNEKRNALLNQFVSYTKAIDELREDSVLEHVPHLQPIFNYLGLVK